MRGVHEIVHRQIVQYEMLRRSERERRPGRAAPAAVQHPPICISRQLGSGAREVALTLSKELGYILFGRDIINEIAKDLKVQRMIVDSLDENSRNNLEVMLATFIEGRQVEDLEYQRSLFRVVQALASQGGVVFLGRGAARILCERSALNVFLTASLEKRIRRVMQYDGVSEPEAREKVKKFDENRDRFHQKLFGNRVGHPCDYDLCINTDRLEPRQAVTLIFRALEARGYDPETMKVPPTSP